MPINFNLTAGGCRPQNEHDDDRCRPKRCPDFVIRRHDTRPSFKIAIDDCDGPMDFRGLIVEANMWCLGRLKADIDNQITYFQLADNIGFNQIMIGDMIVMDRPRMPERMLVTGFDEINKFVQVQRGYHGTTAQPWKKGSHFKVFRTLNAPAESEMTFREEHSVDGTVDKDVIDNAFLVYDWQPEDTCLPGYYWFEFKVLKMIDVVWYLPGGHWEGAKFQDSIGYWYTGDSLNDGTVRLSYDQVTGYYLLPSTPWTGAIHLYTDGNTYTGTAHTDSSVFLNKTGVTFPDNIGLDGDNGILRIIWFIQPGYWNGASHQWTDHNWYTGSSHSDSSVPLSNDPATSLFQIAQVEWSGAFHAFAQNIY